MEKENPNEINPEKIEVKKNEEIQENNEENNNKNSSVPPDNQLNIQIQVNENNMYQLSQETISKLNISSCQICQSQNFFLYIPDSSSIATVPNENTNEKNNEEELNKHNKLDSETIKVNDNQSQKNFLPLLICEQKHQICLVCHQNPHLNTFCSKEYMNSENISQLFEICKENVPEEKKEILDLMCKSALNQCQIESETKSGSCCTCKCTWSIILFIFLLILWTAASAALFAIGLVIIVLALAFKIICCCYHCCYRICCTTTVKDYDEGDHILRVTTHHRDLEEQNDIEAEEHSECLTECGTSGMFCAILLIINGYKKIWEIYKRMSE